MADPGAVALAAGAGLLGGVMNALAGGGTFATLPALIALGLPANIANATSNFALLPGAVASSWTYRDEIAPVGGVDWRLLLAITFVSSLVGSLLLVVTPGHAFDEIIPWLLLIAFLTIAFGGRAGAWLRARTRIGTPTLVFTQILLGVYGGYFGGGVGIMATAVFGLLAGIHPREVFAMRTAMLATANLAAAFIFIWFGMVAWGPALPMIAGGVLGGWLGAHVGKRLSHSVVRWGTILITAATTLAFFHRAYG